MQACEDLFHAALHIRGIVQRLDLGDAHAPPQMAGVQVVMMRELVIDLLESTNKLSPAASEQRCHSSSHPFPIL